MNNKTFLILMLLQITILPVYAQERNSNIHKVQKIIPDDRSHQMDTLYNHLEKVSAGDIWLYTDYDYNVNNTSRQQVDFFDIDNDGITNPMMTAMRRQNQGRRDQIFCVGDGMNNYSILNPFDSTTTYGWGTLDYIEAGPLTGKVIMIAHHNGTSHLTFIDPITMTSTPTPSTFGKNFGSFVYLPEGIIFAITSDMTIYKTNDLGVTWDSVTVLGAGDPNVNLENAMNTPAEYAMSSSKDGNVISICGAFGQATPTDKDIVYLYNSTDRGHSWAGSIIGMDEVYGQISNRPNYAPHFENFGQLTMVVDGNGTTHIAINGFGEGIIEGDTVYVFPALYWNSIVNQWTALTPIEYEGPTDGNGVSMIFPARLYSGNGMGNSYPIVSVSEDGQKIFYAWQAPEFDGEPGVSGYTIYPGDGTMLNPTPTIYTDILGVYSIDGGLNWSDVLYLEVSDSVTEQFPILAPYLEEFENGNAILHYIYMEDVIPNLSVFNYQFNSGNSPSNFTNWRYDNYIIAPTNVNEPVNTIESFSLSQNYPNPFNPATKIKYTVGDAYYASPVKVRLVVYDVLGNEITTLVNEVKRPGIYEVEFHAASLSSGVYFYQLTAGEIIITKNMLLIK